MAKKRRYDDYDGLELADDKPILKVVCWAHARRKFHEAKSSDGTLAETAKAFIRRLYVIEKEIRKEVEQECQNLAPEPVGGASRPANCDRHYVRERLATVSRPLSIAPRRNSCCHSWILRRASRGVRESTSVPRMTSSSGWSYGANRVNWISPLRLRSLRVSLG
ncbi:MAG: transposase [Planctomycetes bacterium]|nr:transposase [Planctomycetota bacterium]